MKKILLLVFVSFLIITPVRPVQDDWLDEGTVSREDYRKEIKRLEDIFYKNHEKINRLLTQINLDFLSEDLNAFNTKLNDLQSDYDSTIERNEKTINKMIICVEEFKTKLIVNNIMRLVFENIKNEAIQEVITEKRDSRLLNRTNKPNLNNWLANSEQAEDEIYQSFDFDFDNEAFKEELEDSYNKELEEKEALESFKEEETKISKLEDYIKDLLLLSTSLSLEIFKKTRESKLEYNEQNSYMNTAESNHNYIYNYLIELSFLSESKRLKIKELIEKVNKKLDKAPEEGLLDFMSHLLKELQKNLYDMENELEEDNNNN